MRRRYAAVAPQPFKLDEALMVVLDKQYARDMDADKCANMKNALYRKA